MAAFRYGEAGNRAVITSGRVECGGGTDTAVREGERPCRLRPDGISGEVQRTVRAVRPDEGTAG